MGTIDDVLLPLFARQHWLVTDDDVRSAGGSASTVTRRLASGRWALADQRVYHLAGAPFTWRSTLLAPILSAGPGAVASHFAAAVLHGLPGYREGTPELTIPRGRERRRPGLLLHTSTDLDRCKTVQIDAIPVTDIERTLLDMGRRLSDTRLARSIEGARRAGLTDWNELIATLVAHARRGRPGIARLRRVIAQNAHRAEITDSDLELMIMSLLLESDLPEPVLHHRVFDCGRFVAEVDLAYPSLRIAIEVDGRVHLEDEVRERDLPRQNDLVLSGWIVLRFTWARLRDRPESIVAEVRAAIRARS